MLRWNLRSQRMSRQHNKQAHCMLSTEVQRSVRLNKKKKSTNISPYPDEAIERLARAFYPAILACWNSEEGQREFAAWQAEQAHHANNEKQEVPAGNSLLYISLSSVAFGRVRPGGRTLFLFHRGWVYIKPHHRNSL